MLRGVGARALATCAAAIRHKVSTQTTSLFFGRSPFPIRSRFPQMEAMSKRWESESPKAPPAEASSGPVASDVSEPEVDQELMTELGLDHLAPSRVVEMLKEDGLTLKQLKMAVDAGLHLAPETEQFDWNAWKAKGDAARTSDTWSPTMVGDLNPRRPLFPGMTYSPEELSPNTPVDYSKIREDAKLKGCPLGGKRGPKIDWTNVQLLSRFLSEGGKIIPKRKTNVCSKKQRELARCIKRARQMNLLPYLSKLPEYQRREPPPIFYKRERNSY